MVYVVEDEEYTEAQVIQLPSITGATDTSSIDIIIDGLDEKFMTFDQESLTISIDKSQIEV